MASIIQKPQLGILLFLLLCGIVPQPLYAQQSYVINDAQTQGDSDGPAINATSTMNVLEQIHITGTVVDESGNPLVGVTVKVKGKSKGTVTDTNGKFLLEVEPTDSLIFSFVGYLSKIIYVGGKKSFIIQLRRNNQQLSQFVVIGYGSQRKEDLTGSVGSVQLETISNQPITSATEALAGQIAGVQVNTTNGIPGGGPQIQVRGVGAIGAGNSPLYVVDGFPLPSNSENSMQVSNPLNIIPPSDIASISVLKGPSATAIYGSRASNGVVIIKTKSGSKGKFQFHINAYTGIQKIPNRVKPKMMNAREFATWQKEWILDNNRVTGAKDTVPKPYQDPSRYGEGTNWFDALTRTAPIQNISFSGSGGNEKIQSYFSASYFRQKGVVLGTNYNRISLRANANANITSKLQIGLLLSPTYSFGKTGTTGSNGRNDFLGRWEILSPIEPVYNADGSYNSFITGPKLLGAENPVEALITATNYTKNADFLGTFFVIYDILNDLKIKSTLNVDWNNRSNRTFRPSTIGGFNTPPPSIPSGSLNQRGYLNWVNENQITYDHTFKGGHHINLLGVLSEQRQLYNSANFGGSQFPDDEIETLNAAAKITGRTDIESWALVSYLGRLNYSYKDRYLLTATLRRDGSSKFGPNNRWGTFPSIALGWRISNEPWMAGSSSWLSNLKLRGGYGLTGNDQIGTYAYAATISQGNYILNNSLAAGKIMTSLGNQNLTWAQTKELDLGLDIGLLANRISLTADFYRSIVNNMLLNVELPQSSGFSNATENIGKVRNYGFEVEIKSLNVDTKDFTWYSNLNFSLNRNKVLALGPSGEPIKANAGWGGIYGQSITKIGKPIGLFYGWKFLGLYQNKHDVESSPSYAGAVPGALKLADINGDGKLTPNEDFTIIGSPYPDFTYGMTNTLSYKNLTLTVVFTGSYGGEVFKASFGSTHNTDGVFNVTKDQKNRWRSPEQPGNGKIPTTVGTENRLIYRSMGSWSLFNASYLWMKNINLAYTLPQSITKGYLRNVVVYASIQNAFIFTPYKLGNPATTDYIHGNTLTPGVDWSSYPVPRISTIGIRIDF